MLANRSNATASLTLRYTESLSGTLGVAGTVSVTLKPLEQRIIPDAIDFLRRNGAQIGNAGAASFAGRSGSQ